MVYDNIKKISEKRNIPITEIERRAGLGRGAIGKWRTFSPTISNLQKVADALGVSIKTLLK